MTDDDLKTIETAVGVSLPPEYRDAAESGKVSDPIHDDSRAIIGINNAFRSGEFGDSSWGSDLIAFGHDGAGNYFCFYASRIHDGFFLRDHETLKTRKENNSFSEVLVECS